MFASPRQVPENDFSFIFPTEYELDATHMLPVIEVSPAESL